MEVCTLIIEHALLHVRSGEKERFEAAMRDAKPLIAASPGFQSIAVRRTEEGDKSLYLLLVEWDDIASHKEGFRTSDRYQQWRALLHPFYEPMPEVRYFGEPL